MSLGPLALAASIAATASSCAAVVGLALWLIIRVLA